MIAAGQLQYQELAVYDNQIITGLLLGQYDLAVLTSPLNVESFFTNGGRSRVFMTLGTATETTLGNFAVKRIGQTGPSDVQIYEAIIRYLDQRD